ncbi:MAG: transglutaminase [Acidobacteria bacterium]|nr:MAG: transglutaminase [Acidobacteriota bacterium]
MNEYLASTYFIDFESDAVQSFVTRVVGSVDDPRAKAILLFNAVRDELWYDPYSVNLDRDAYRASVILGGRTAYCVPKAIVMAAAGRAVGLPTRLGYADVRNHLATPRLLEQLGTDVFAFHGFTEVFLEDRWVKVTPTFNSRLCERFGVLPLEFDGISDTLFQPFDASGKRHMEYIRERGTFADFPFEEMLRVYAEVYPSLGSRGLDSDEGGPFIDAGGGGRR